MPVNDVIIAGVRGIKNATRFPLHGHSLLLHGDNGTGKSSFERALRWALRGEEEPTSDVAFSNAESFRRHVRAEIGDPSVTVTFTDDSTIAVRPGEFAATGNGRAIRDACVAGQPFLRRSELLSVLGDRPVDRFTYFETFLGLQRVDQVIEEVSTRRTAVQARAGTLASRLDSALEPLRSLLPARLGARRTLEEVFAAAAEWARELSLQATTALERTKELQARAGSLASGDVASFPYRLQESGSAISSAQALIETVAKGIPELIRKEVAASAVLVDSADVELLMHALDHFRRREGDICPVCQQSVVWSRTLDLLQSRVSTLEEYRQVQKALADAARSIGDAASRIQLALAEAAGVAAKLGLGAAYPFSAPPEIDTVVSFRTATELLAFLRSIDVDATIATTVSACEIRAADVIRLQGLIPDTRDLPELQTAAAFYERLREIQPAAELLRAEREALEKESTSLSAVVEALRRSRQDVAKETLTAIECLVSEYYLKIHPPGTPDDATGAPSIDVQRHGRGTAFVRGEFAGTDIKDPTWVYSDGHLDTVGLCIFLALRRFRSAQNGDPKIMVLDDVIISIDLGHSRRFLDLLKNSFEDHQVLILTHNGLFAHWCRTLLPRLTRLEIKGWSLEGGPNVGDYDSARERVENAIVDGTAKEIAVALMELLDEWTAEARYEYQVAVPAKPGEQYTLGEIWDPLAARVKTIAKYLKSDLDGVVGLLESLKDIPQVRNALAGHYNDFAQEFPRGAIAAIAGDACKLVDALYCRECTAFVVPIGSRSNPSLMECPGHHKQYLAKAATLG